jgi:hypothetical protein
MSEKQVYIAQAFPPASGHRLKALKAISGKNWLEFLILAGESFIKSNNISEQAIAEAVAKEIAEAEAKLKKGKEPPAIPPVESPPANTPAPEQKPV